MRPQSARRVRMHPCAGDRAQERQAASDKQDVTGPVFRFRLERVRAVRERREKLAKQELAEAISRRSSSQADLRTTDAHLEQARDEQRTVSAEPTTVSATDLLARQAFLERIEAQRGRHARELAQREAEVADSDARLATAASEHEMLKRLSERRRGEHDREAARRERNVLDDIAAARFGRSSA
jgi:flagellar export protein FliJ